MQYLHNRVYHVIVWLLMTMLSAAAPSVRPGVGAIPYAGGTTFRVWAPNASSVHVAGTFNGWNTTSPPLYSEGSGWWAVDVPWASISQQ